jgi:hypothetical protein
MFKQLGIQINNARRGMTVVWPCTQKDRTSSLMSLESKYKGQRSTENHGKIIQVNTREERTR